MVTNSCGLNHYGVNKMIWVCLVSCRGICSKAPCYCIIMEFCRQGALYDVLRKRDQNVLPPQVVGWSRQIASGMQFLHSHHIIHRDLKSPKSVSTYPVYIIFTYLCPFVMHVFVVCVLLTCLGYHSQ